MSYSIRTMGINGERSSDDPERWPLTRPKLAWVANYYGLLFGLSISLLGAIFWVLDRIHG